MTNEKEDLNHSLDSSKLNMFGSAVVPLTEGFLKIYQPALTQVEKVLKELTDKESMLLEQIHGENLSIAEMQHSDEFNEIFSKIDVYQAKLANIKRDMKSLHDKSIKLKKRALRIQQFKEKQDYVKQQKEAELKMEQDLIAKTNTQ